MRQGRAIVVADVSVLVEQGPGVLLGKVDIADICCKVVEVRIEGSLPVIVDHRSIRKAGVSDGEVENIRVTVALARRWRGKIARSLPIDLNMHFRMLEKQFAQRNLGREQRLNLDANCELVGMQQRRLVGAFRAVQGDVVEHRSEGGETEVEPSHGSSGAHGGGGCFADFTESQSLKRGALQIEIPSEHDDNDQNYEDNCCPNGPSFPSHSHLESLSNGDVVLPCIEAGHRIQITSEIKAYRPNRGLITESQADCI